MKKEDAEFLLQLIDPLEKAEARLEWAYKKKDYDEFYKLKKFIMQIQQKISEVIG